MQTWKMWAMALGLALTSSAALAFQQQNSGAPQGGNAPASQAAGGSTGDAGKTLELAPADVSTKPGSAGTEVRIPGLGKLGVLPKMDFGLELLYGAAESKRIEPQRDSGSDDVTIRGTLKHRF